MKRGGFIIGGLLVALILAGVVSFFAADTPDGLEYSALRGCTVDEDGQIVDGECIAQGEQEHPLGTGPFADYGVRGVNNAFLANGLSGVVGVVLTFGVGAGLFWVIRRRAPAGPPED